MKRPDSASWEGAVLVGGRSRRMGQDKARLLMDGLPLWRRQVRLIKSAGATRASVILRKGQHTLPWAGCQLRDAVSGAGPLAGIVAGLAQCRSAWFLALAVDLGELEPRILRHLFRHCRARRGAIFLGEHGYEPLAAFYPVEALPVFEDALQSGLLSLQLVVRRLVRMGLVKPVAIPRGQATRLSNWNRPEDLPTRRR